jgi:hypothetical protein
MKTLFKSQNSSIRNWELTRDIASFIGAITSIAVIWAIVFNNLSEALGNRYIAGTFSALTVAGVLFIVDWGLRADLGYGFDLLFSGSAWKNWRLSAFLILLLGFNVIRSAVTITLSWQGRKDVVLAVSDAPELADVAKAKTGMDAASSARLNGIQKQVADLQSQITAAEAGAGSAALRKLAASGNGWAKSELSRARSNASRGLKKQLEIAQAAYTRIATTDAQAAASAVNALAVSNTAKLDRYQDISSRNMAYLGYFGAGCTFIVILVSLMLSLLNTAEQDTPVYSYKHNVNGNNVAPVVAPMYPPNVLPVSNTATIGATKRDTPGVTNTATVSRDVAAVGDTFEWVKKPRIVATGQQKTTSDKDTLRRKIAQYKRRAVSGTLSEKGQASLEKWQAQYNKMK